MGTLQSAVTQVSARSALVGVHLHLPLVSVFFPAAFETEFGAFTGSGTPCTCPPLKRRKRASRTLASRPSGWSVRRR